MRKPKSCKRYNRNKRNRRCKTRKQYHKRRGGMRAVGRVVARQTGDVLTAYIEGEGQAWLKGQDTIVNKIDKAEKIRNMKTPNVLTPINDENIGRNKQPQYKPPKFTIDI